MKQMRVFCVAIVFINWISTFNSWHYSRFCPWFRKSHAHSLKMVTVDRPTTYKPVQIMDSKSKTKRTLLIKNADEDIINEVQSWNKAKPLDEDIVSKWTQDGLAFWLDTQGTIALQKSEANSVSVTTMKKPNSMKYNADVFVNVAPIGSSELQLVSAQCTSAIEDVRSGVLDIATLERRGEAFSNISMLISDRQVVNRADEIARRLWQDYSPQSPLFQTWINKTAKYNATSLSQVVAYYFHEHSAGDVGGKAVNYSPKRGYPGTLGPGEFFKDNNPVEELPNRILHPWPAMQEFQFHVRMPPSHPMIAPPVLWFAMNDMFTENYTRTQLESNGTDMCGGMCMEPKHALRIARNANFGMSYDPKDQIAHGGSIFKGGFPMNNYHPDHGPTVPADEAEPPIPEELKPFVERWLDPYFGLNMKMTALPSRVGEGVEEEEAEEAQRLAAAEGRMSALGGDAALFSESVETQEEWMESSLNASMSGRPRIPTAIIRYSIATLQKMKGEMQGLEREVSYRKKFGRNRKKRQDLDLEGPLPFDTSPSFDAGSRGAGGDAAGRFDD